MDQDTHFHKLFERVGVLEKELAEQKRINSSLKMQSRGFGLKVRELECLYSISQLIDNRYMPLEEILKKIVDLIPLAWKPEENICVRIIVGDDEFATSGYSETGQKQEASIVINGTSVGKLEVSGFSVSTEQGEDVVDMTRSQFVNAVAKRLESFIDNRRTEEVLFNYHDKLEIEMIEANEELKKEIENRKQTETALRENEGKYRIVLESSPDPIVIYDMDDNVTFLNRAFTQTFGWSLEECKGTKIDFMPMESMPETMLIEENIAAKNTFTCIETCRRAKNGSRVDVGISNAFYYDAQKKPLGYVMTFQNITERKRTEKEILFLSYHDILTGLPNRRSFYKILEEKLFWSQRRVMDDKWALLFLDLDRFKYINDTLGHDVGDELIKILSHRLRNCLRKTDSIFRLGGDEFTIILSNVIREYDVAKVVSKLRKSMAQACFINNQDLYTTVSIGISIYPDDGRDVETLVKNADLAMYAAKEEEDGFRFYTEEMNRKAIERLKIGNSLNYALQDNQFIVYYQPLVDSNELVIGMEALLRWNHPQMGMVNPEKFIPMAEETGIIVSIGEWVLKSACHQAKKWYNKGYTDIFVSVNLSTRQFREKDIVEMVKHVLASTGLPPECLKLEVTESGIMDNPEQAIVRMKQLCDIGVRFAIDDFGTGYSSLSYMKRFPVEILKIDRSFIIDSMSNRDDREIIKTIIAMATNLGIETLAEGVETREQKEFLARNGCDKMQGFLFGRAVPSVEFEQLLMEQNTQLEDQKQQEDGEF